MKNLSKLGVIVPLSRKLDDTLNTVRHLGLSTVQLSCFEPEILTDTFAVATRNILSQCGIEVTSFWAGYSGRLVWNFMEGPATIGIVPGHSRQKRVHELLKGVEFAKGLGAPSVTTHLGFIPEDPQDSEYDKVVKATRKVAEACNEAGMHFCFETGQETPVTLLRCIEDVGTDNLGINLDPANLILYGKANPVDAMEVFGKYVKGVHAKDGNYPTTPRELGQEKPLGQGSVDFPALINKLKKYKYNGAITIEREITGPQQTRDIKKAITFLNRLL